MPPPRASACEAPGRCAHGAASTRGFCSTNRPVWRQTARSGAAPHRAAPLCAVWRRSTQSGRRPPTSGAALRGLAPLCAVWRRSARSGRRPPTSGAAPRSLAPLCAVWRRVAGPARGARGVPSARGATRQGAAPRSTAPRAARDPAPRRRSWRRSPRPGWTTRGRMALPCPSGRGGRSSRARTTPSVPKLPKSAKRYRRVEVTDGAGVTTARRRQAVRRMNETARTLAQRNPR